MTPAIVDFTGVFNFESLIQNAVETVFNGLGFTMTLTPDDLTQFYKVRPRLEIMVKDSGAIPFGNQGASMPDPLYGLQSGLTRAAAYTAELHLTVATNSKEVDKSVLALWRAAVRYYAGQLPVRCATLLTTLSLRRVEPHGGTMIYRNEQGYLECGLVFVIQFAIKPGALQQAPYNSTP